MRYGGDYGDFAKTLVNLDKVAEKSVLVERHGDKYAGTLRENRNLASVSVLFGVFRDGKNIIPVQMEIKKTSDTGSHLYMTVTMTKIEADVLGTTIGKNPSSSLISASEYNIADIFREINPNDAHFLKYLPDNFLSDGQIQAKRAALQEDANRIAKDKSKAAETINKAGPAPAGESPKNGSLATPIDSASLNGIQQNGAEVNGNPVYSEISGNTQQTDTTTPSANASQSTPAIGAAAQNFTGKSDYQQLLSNNNAQPDRADDVRPMIMGTSQSGNGKNL